MSKKRIFTVVVAIVMSLCAIALAGCSKKDNEDVTPPVEYTVTYYGNGGFFGELSKRTETVAENGYAKGDVEPVHPEGYDFLGWSADRNSDVTVNLSTVPVTADVKYYAVWDDGSHEAEKYTVTYYWNYTGAPDPVFKTVNNVTSGSTVSAPTPAPSRGAEWHFDGWFTASNGGTEFNFGASVTGNLYLYAHWSPVSVAEKYTVTYYWNYTGAPNPVFKTVNDVTSGSNVSEPSPAPSRGAEWHFDGWYTAAEGGSLYNFQTAVTGNLPLYAHWSPMSEEPVMTGIEVYQRPFKLEYVVGQTFDDSGLIVRALYNKDRQPETLAKGTDYTVSPPDMNVLGPQTVTVTYKANDSFTDEFTITIIAKAVASLEITGSLTNTKQFVGAYFDPAGLTFTAVYNDGERRAVTDVSQIAFTSSLLTAEGKFNGDGNAVITVTYQDIPSETKLTVSVEVPPTPKYNLIYEKNNDVYEDSITGMPKTPQIIEENTAANEPADPVLKGFTFEGWYTDAACSGSAWDFSTRITEDTTLYAKWEAIEYTVDYKLNGGTNLIGNKKSYTATNGVFEEFTLLDPAKDHNIFGGWYIDQDYTTSITKITYDTVIEHADANNKLTLYAKFTPKQFDISYEWGGANGVDYNAKFKDGYTAPAEYTYGTGVTLPGADNIEIKVLKAGEAVEFNFLGWYVKGGNRNDHVTAVLPTQSDNKTFVADIVEAAVCAVTYDYNDGTDGGSTKVIKNVVKGNHAAPLPSDPTRDGYTFDNWYTAAEGGSVFDFATTEINTATTVYAHWDPISYTVKFEGLPAGAANGNSTTYNVTLGDVTLAAPTGLTAGYRFFGWYSDPTLKNPKDKIVPADIASAEDNVITVYASCNNKYTVTFVENVTGVTVTDMPQDVENVVYGDGIARPSNIPKRDDYTFAGWFVDKDCLTPWIFAGETGTATPVTADYTDLDAKCEIYAKWTENPESGMYLIGTVGGKSVEMSSADIADYKLTEVKSGENVTAYTMSGVTLKDGDSFRVIEYIKTTGTLKGDVPAAAAVVYPVNAFKVTKQDGFYTVAAHSDSRGITAADIATFTWDIELKIDGEDPKFSELYVRMVRTPGIDAQRAPDGTAATYAPATRDNNTTYIYGSMTGYLLDTDEWSDGKDSVLDCVKTANGDLVINNVKLFKYDEIAVHTADTYLFGGAFVALGTPVALGNSGNQFLMFTGETGVYNIVIAKTGGKYTSLTIYEQKTLTVEFKADAPIYIGKTPEKKNLTVKLGGTEITDYEIVAKPASGTADSVTVVYLVDGVFTEAAYTAVADSIKSIEIKTQPAVKDYYVGGTLDFSDIVLTVTYNSGDVIEASKDADTDNRITFELPAENYDDGTGKFVKAGDIEVTVKFDGTTFANCKVAISVHNELTSIVITEPTTTEYVSGVSENINTAGLVVTAYYNGTTADDGENAVTAVIPEKAGEADGYTLDTTAYNFNLAGDYKILVSYTEVFGSLTATKNGDFTVTVVEPQIIRIAASGTLTNETQLIGSTFDSDGLTFLGTKNDKNSSTEPINASKMKYEITVGGVSATNEAGLLVKSGSATVKAIYGEGEAAITVELTVTLNIKDRLTSIGATEPTKASYPQCGAEKAAELLETAGMTVTAKYNEGIDGAEVVTGSVNLLDKCTVTADFSTIGEDSGIITVSYTDENGITKTATVNVKVTEPVIDHIEIDTTGGYTDKYYVGDKFDGAALAITAVKDNGDTVSLSAADMTFNGGNAFTEAGDKTVTAVYKADTNIPVTGTITVTVYDKLTSIVVTTEPTAPHEQADGTKIWVVGDEVVLKDIVITAYYNGTTAADGASAVSKQLADADFTTNANEIKTDTAGIKTITVTYVENLVRELTVTCDINIDVKELAIAKFECSGTAATQYKAANFNASGLEFTATYNNDSTKKVDVSEVTFTSTAFKTGTNTFNLSGSRTVTATYSGKSCEISVTVEVSDYFTVTYVANITLYTPSGIPAQNSVAGEATVTEPTAPTLKGFTFGGWYKEESCSNKWTFGEGGDQVLDNITLYAKWTPIRYIVSFNQEDGLPIKGDYFEAENGKFGTLNLMTVTPPAKENHNHVGWYIDGAAEKITLTVLDYDALPEIGTTVTLKPVYEIFKYTVTFVYDNGSENTEQEVEYNATATAPTAPTKDHYTFGGWFEGSSATAFDFANTPITENITLTAHWTPVKYTVTFESNGGNTVTAQQIDYNELVEEPANPTKAHYEFGGWYSDEELTSVWNFGSDKVQGTITLYAKWTEVYHSVTFDSDGGSAVEAQSIFDGNTATAPTDPTRKHYTFAGWFKAGETEAFDFATPITADVALTAKWDAYSYTIEYNCNGEDHTDGGNPTEYKVTDGNVTLKDAVTSLTTELFDCWHDVSGNPVTEITPDLFDNLNGKVKITVYAIFVQKSTVTVTFDLNGATGTAPEALTVDGGSIISKPATDPTRDHYTFGGWCRDKEGKTPWNFETDKATSNITLYAKWIEKTYTVTFDTVDGGTIEAQTVREGSSATAPTEPTKEHYTFGGWFAKDATEAFDFANTPITADITLTAKWIPVKYTVTFNSNDGSAVAEQKVDYGKAVVKPANPTKAGFSFGGWYKDAELKTAWDFETDTVAGDMTLYANWTEITYTVTFNSDGGSAVEKQTVREGTHATAPTEAPTKEHYTFGGWFAKDATEAFDFENTSITADITLTAHWTPVKYTVTFNSNGGGTVAEQKVDYGKAVDKPANPTKAGFTFAGWYKDAELKTAWDFETDTVAGDMTLYANWTENKFTVTYHANAPVVKLADGKNIATPVVGVDETPINIADKVVEPTDKPTLAGFTFGGWYTDAACTAAKKYTFGSEVTANVELYAKWTENTTEGGKAIGGLYVGGVYKAKLIDNGSTASVVAFKVQHIILNKGDVLTFRFNGKNITSKVSVRGTANVSGFTPGAIGNGETYTLKVTTSGSFSLYYSNTTDTTKDRFWVAPEPPYVAPTLKDTDGVYVDGELVLKFTDDDNSLNKVIAEGKINNADVDDHTMHAITLQYNGKAVATIILNVKSGITTNPAAAESGSTTKVSTFKMYSGTYKFYYAYALSDDCAANRLWVEGTQAGGPDLVIPEGAVAVKTDTVYLVGKFGGSSVTYDYGYAMNEDSSTQHSITKVLAVGDMFAGWHKGWNMWVADLENDMTGKLTETTVDGKTYLKVVTAGTYTLYCKHVSGGTNQFYVGYSSGGDTGDKEPVLTGKSAVFKFSDATIVICLTNVPSWATAGSEFVHIWTNDTDGKDCSLDGKSTYTFAGKLTSYNILVAFKEGTAWKKTSNLTNMACNVDGATKTMSDGHVYTFNTGANASGSMSWVTGQDGVFEYTCKETAITYKE